MIRELLTALGKNHDSALRRLLVRAGVAALAQGFALALLVPVLRALLGPAPGTAWSPYLAFAVCAAIAVAAQFSAQKHGFTVGVAVARQLHERLGVAIARVPLGWFTKTRIGALTRMNTDQVLGVMNVPAHLLRMVANGVLTPVAILLALCFIEPRMALALALAAPVLYAVQRFSAGRIQRADAERGVSATDTANRILEFAQNQPVIRAFGGRTALDDALQAGKAAEQKMLWRSLPGLVSFDLTLRLVIVIVLALGVELLLDGAVDAPTLLALLVLLVRCAEPVATLAELGAALRLARNSLHGINEVLAVQPLAEPTLPRRPERFDVEFDEVRFGYDDRQVLRGVSFALPERGITALVGSSGAGKSTVARLLGRFADVDDGEVRIGGVPVREIATEDLMSSVSFVFQDTYLFDGSLRDNIRIADPTASDERIREVATKAGLGDLDIELAAGEEGLGLSNGQRQRVSIARVLLKDAPIVVLDEPTSALDPEHGAIVRATVTELARTKTVLVIAHRLDIVVHAGQVLVLDDGLVVERGTHDQLLAAHGRYARLWQAHEHAHGWRLTTASTHDALDPA
ncbi:ABC transporter ATP-binding protein/permease [Kibdelosporangium philippinense]|uniref:ABC transporter ATP-binding protein/permease n=1 Tax=Kibdelosporangium philippinense TaxID=211113 RepID=A0ABS8ZHK6_9PSEU|nr:ABC transporter ATP-binding protein [Kibdelosporangium philippinense]MCE7007294.1 ABC transporter ATP-binding protein/permease [Kibdelosporangium philippinense]